MISRKFLENSLSVHDKLQPLYNHQNFNEMNI